MRIPQIDKIRPKSAAFCIRFQFFTVLSLISVAIKYRFIVCVITWYQFFTCVSIWYQFYRCHFFTYDNLIFFCRSENLVQILHTCEDLVPILQIYENLVPILYIVLVLNTLKTLKCEIRAQILHPKYYRY